MGSSVITQIILFIAVIGIATGFVTSMKAYSDRTEVTMKEKNDAFNNQLKTDFSIEVVHYNNDTKKTSVYLKNIGSTVLRPEDMDIYINGIRLPRNDTNRTINVETDTDSVNIGLWDNNEELKIVANMDLEENKIHELIVTGSYDSRELYEFST